MNKQEKPSKATQEQWRHDPSNWKMGVFYFNKSDKRIFPPKRYKQLGWTVNFANPASYLSFIALVCLCIMVLNYRK